MPRYYFDLHDGYEVFDKIGRDFPDLDAAKSEAMRVAAGFSADPRMLGGDGGAVVIVIRDGPGGKEVCTIRLAFTISKP